MQDAFLEGQSTNSRQALQRKRRLPKAQPISETEWNQQEENIHQLYLIEDLKLPDLITQMKERFGFVATYGTRLLSKPTSRVTDFFKGRCNTSVSWDAGDSAKMSKNTKCGPSFGKRESAKQSIQPRGLYSPSMAES